MFTNTKVGELGSLTISKELLQGTQPQDTDFPFQLLFQKDGEFVPYTGAATLSGSSTEVTNGAFSLKNRQSIQVENIPIGTKYQVRELPGKDYLLQQVIRTEEGGAPQSLSPNSPIQGQVTGEIGVGLTFVNGSRPADCDSKLEAQKRAEKCPKVGRYDIVLSVTGEDGWKSDPSVGTLLPLYNTQVSISDPMSPYVTLVGADGLPITGAHPLGAQDISFSVDGVEQSSDQLLSQLTFQNGLLTWNLGRARNGVCYELRYSVAVDVNAPGYSGDRAPDNSQVGYPVETGKSGYPANGKTVLHYTSGGQGHTADITVPVVWQRANSLIVKKVDDSGQPLSGAQFSIEPPAGFPTPKVTYWDANGKQTPNNDDKTAVKFVFDNLYDGSYTITEETAPFGCEKVQPFTVDFSGLENADASQARLHTENPQLVKSQGGGVVVTNQKKWITPAPRVTLTKRLGDGPALMDGKRDFPFRLYYPSSGEDFLTLVVTLEQGTDHNTADITQVLKNAFPKGLPIGDYRMEEEPSGPEFYLPTGNMTLRIGERVYRSDGEDGISFSLTGQDEGKEIAVEATNLNALGRGFTLTKVLKPNGLAPETFYYNLYRGERGTGGEQTLHLLAWGRTGEFSPAGQGTQSAPVEWFESIDGEERSFDPARLSVGDYYVEEVPQEHSNFTLDGYTVGGQPVSERSAGSLFPSKSSEAATGPYVHFEVTGSGEQRDVKVYNGPGTGTGTVAIEQKLEGGYGLPGEELSYSLTYPDGHEEELGKIQTSSLTETHPTASVVSGLRLPNGVYTLTQRLPADSSFAVDSVEDTCSSGTQGGSTYTFTVDSENNRADRLITFTNRAKSIGTEDFQLLVSKAVDEVHVPDEAGKTFHFTLQTPSGQVLTSSVVVQEPGRVQTCSFAGMERWEYGTYTVKEVQDNPYYEFVSVKGTLGSGDRSYGRADPKGAPSYTFTVDGSMGDNMMRVDFKNRQRPTEPVSLTKEMEKGSVLLRPGDRFQIALWDGENTSQENPLETLSLSLQSPAALSSLKVGGTYYLKEMGVMVGTQLTPLGAESGYENAGMAIYTAKGLQPLAEVEPGKGVYRLTVDPKLEISGVVVENRNLYGDLTLKKVVEGVDPNPGTVFALSVKNGEGSQNISISHGGSEELTGLRLGDTYTVTETPSKDYQLTSMELLLTDGERVPLPIKDGSATFVMEDGYRGATLLVTNGVKTGKGVLTLEKTLENPFDVSVSGEEFAFLLYHTQGGVETLYAQAVFDGSDDGSLRFQGWKSPQDGKELGNSLQNLPVGRYTLEEAEPSVGSRFVTDIITCTGGQEPLADLLPGDGANRFTFEVTQDTGDLAFSVKNRALDTRGGTAVGGLSLHKEFTHLKELAAGHPFQVKLTGLDNGVLCVGTVSIQKDLTQSVSWKSEKGAPPVLLDRDGNLVLPLGSFDLQEILTGESFCFQSFETGAGVLAGNRLTIGGDMVGKTTDLTVTNAPVMGSGLTLTKELEQNGLLPEEFTFLLAGDNGFSAYGRLEADAQYVDGRAQVLWYGDGSYQTPVSVTSLPVGQYTVTETSSSENFTLDGFEILSPNGSVTPDKKSLHFTVTPSSQEVKAAVKNGGKGDGVLVLRKLADLGGFPQETFSFVLTGPTGTRTLVLGGEDGLVKRVEGLSYGTYTLREVESADGYTGSQQSFVFDGFSSQSPGTVIQGNSIRFTLDSQNKVETVEAKNTLRTGAVTIDKTVTDLGGLSGRTFTFSLRGEDGAILGTKTMDYPTSKSITFENIPFGSYTIAEVADPLFTLVPETVSVQTMDRDRPNLTFCPVNRLNRSQGQLLVLKSAPGADNLPSESFTFTLSGAGKTYEGRVADSHDAVVSAPVEWRAEGTGGQWGPLPKLDYGVYTLTETTHSPSFVLQSGVSSEKAMPLTHNQDGSYQFVIGSENDRLNPTITLTSGMSGTGTLSLQKVFEGNQNPFPNGEFTFVLTGPKGAVQDLKVSAASGWSVQATHLPYGRYTITEAEDENFTFLGFVSHRENGIAPKTLSFTLDGNTPSISLVAENQVKQTQKGSGTLTLRKTFSQNQMPFEESFVCSLLGPDGESTQVVLNRENNWVATLDTLMYGSYTLTETVDPQSAYAFDRFLTGEREAAVEKNQVSFTIGEKEGQLLSLHVDVQNRVKTASLLLTASNRLSAGENLSPEKRTFDFVLTDPDGVKTNYTMSAGLSDQRIFDPVEQLPYGVYTLIQADNRYYDLSSCTPTGTALDSRGRPQPVVSELRDGDKLLGYQLVLDSRSDGKTLNLGFVNTPKGAQVVLKKSLVDGPPPEEGQTFSFKIWKADTHEPGQANLQVAAGETVALSDLRLGVRYLITEELDKTSAYQLVSLGHGGKPLTEEGDGVYSFVPSSLEADTLEAVNRVKTGELSVKKVDTQGGPVRGAEFTLSQYAKDGTYGRELARLTSDENGDIHFGEFPVGSYVLTETRVPTGYLTPATATLVELAVDDSGQVVLKDGSGTVLANHTAQILNRRRGGSGAGGGDAPGEPPERIEENPIPLGGSVPGLEVIEDGKIPLGTLPDTGGFPVGVLAPVGAALVGVGLLLRRGQRGDQPDPLKKHRP